MNAKLATILPEKYCISTITCDNFAVGTEVMLYSVLKHNPWFRGDINIVIADLSAENRARLEKIYPVRFLPASGELIARVDALRGHFAYLRDIHLRFYSLESFQMQEYDKVVYLDSDMHCAGDIRELFLSLAPLEACLDGFSYEDRIVPIIRDAGLAVPENLQANAQRYGKQFKNSFNAGVITIRPGKLRDFDYAQLLAILDVDAWQSYGRSIFTDQMVLNRYFEDQFTLLPSSYNYMVFLGDYLDFVDGISAQQARLIHFAGKIKPWNNYDAAAIWQNAAHYLPFIQQWRSLLAEARSDNLSQYQAHKLLQQYQWIEAGADHQLQALGRVY